MLDPKGLAKFCRMNKNCNKLLDPRSKYCVNFKVLFEEQFGIQLTQADVEETLISTSRALAVALKYTMLKSIVKSQHIIGKRVSKRFVQGTVTIPNLEKIATLKELRNLSITKF